jgi:hypothetical protein
MGTPNFKHILNNEKYKNGLLTATLRKSNFSIGFCAIGQMKVKIAKNSYFAKDKTKLGHLLIVRHAN